MKRFHGCWRISPHPADPQNASLATLSKPNWADGELDWALYEPYRSPGASGATLASGPALSGALYFQAERVKVEVEMALPGSGFAAELDALTPPSVTLAPRLTMDCVNCAGTGSVPQLYGLPVDPVCRICWGYGAMLRTAPG